MANVKTTIGVATEEQPEIEVIVEVGAATINAGESYTKHETDILLEGKQDKLVSGENIKTINGESILGEGDIVISFDAVQSDWDEQDAESLAFIQNKPDLSNYVTTGSLSTVATSGDYDDLLNKPTIPDAPVQSDWNESDTGSLAFIQNKPDLSNYVTTGSLSTVATSGDYDDLLNKPTIPDAPVQSDWNESDTGSLAFIKNKPDLSNYATTSALQNMYLGLTGMIAAKQDTLVSGSNIKTINNETILGSGNISIQAGSSVVDYVIDYSKRYFTIKSLANNNVISWKASNSSLLKTISVSTNDGATWTDYESTTAGTTIATLNKNEYIFVKGENTQYGKKISYNVYYNTFIFSQNGLIEGNIMSLVYGDNFIGKNSLYGWNDEFQYAFKSLFEGNTKLKNAENLILPALDMNTWSYSCMFSGCTSLTTPPALPATSLSSYDYDGMFMNCTSLTTAPVLPATRPTTWVYNNMFNGCTSLNFVKCPATYIGSNGCTANWLSNVSATGTFITANTPPAWSRDASGIPAGWNVYTEAEWEYAHNYQINSKQDTLISGSNIKTINNETILGSGNISIQGGSDIDYSKRYFTIKSLADNNTITWKATDASIVKTISVSTDDGATWTQYTSSTSGTTIATLDEGEYIFVKGNNSTYADFNAGYIYNTFLFSDYGDVEGNIMSLVYEDNFIGQISLATQYMFANLFRGNTKLRNANRLILPATTLANNCYESMFDGCSDLITPPALPATTLAQNCYCGMFSGCTSLTTPPALPATTLFRECYALMFENCTSLTTAPALPATLLADYCYNSMFLGCTSLTTAPALPAMLLPDYCYVRMFENCTSLTTAPALPATIFLKASCYDFMFYGCSSLNKIICVADDGMICDHWVDGVASTGTFIKNVSNTTWGSGVDGIPSGWTVQDY